MKPLSDDAGLVQLDDDPKSTFRTDGTGFSSSYDHIYVLENETSEYVDGSCNTLHTAQVAYGNDNPDTMKKARSQLWVFPNKGTQSCTTIRGSALVTGCCGNLVFLVLESLQA